MGVRKHFRYESKGRVYVTDAFSTEALLKNVSSSGLCVKSSAFMGIVPNYKYTVVIYPEEEACLEPFNIEAESKWILSKRDHSESGFIIAVPPGTSGEKMLNWYLHFLVEHSMPVDYSETI